MGVGEGVRSAYLTRPLYSPIYLICLIFWALDSVAVRRADTREELLPVLFQKHSVSDFIL